MVGPSDGMYAKGLPVLTLAVVATQPSRRDVQ